MPYISTWSNRFVKQIGRESDFYYFNYLPHSTLRVLKNVGARYHRINIKCAIKCNFAGFDGNPVWLARRTEGSVFSTFPRYHYSLVSISFSRKTKLMEKSQIRDTALYVFNSWLYEAKEMKCHFSADESVCAICWIVLLQITLWYEASESAYLVERSESLQHLNLTGCEYSSRHDCRNGRTTRRCRRLDHCLKFCQIYMFAAILVYINVSASLTLIQIIYIQITFPLWINKPLSNRPSIRVRTMWFL